jgi:hypothetical protein
MASQASLRRPTAMQNSRQSGRCWGTRYRVVYSDGDSEDFTIDELQKFLVANVARE